MTEMRMYKIMKQSAMVFLIKGDKKESSFEMLF